MRRVLFAQLCAKDAKCTATFGRVSVRGDSPEKWTDAESKRDFENLVKTLLKPC